MYIPKSKKCRTCEEAKDLSDFYKHRLIKDGHANECKGCQKKRAKAWYQSSQEKRRNKSKQYYEENREKILEYRHTDKFRAFNAKGVAKYAKNNREKVKAQQKLNHEIIMGRIVRPIICEGCGRNTEKLIQGHHYDYSKPLDVIWLCIECHADIHRKTSNQELTKKR